MKYFVVIFLVVFVVIGVSANCGCLKCNKQLQTVDIPGPDGTPIKVIYKRPQTCLCGQDSYSPVNALQKETYSAKLYAPPPPSCRRTPKRPLLKNLKYKTSAVLVPPPPTATTTPCTKCQQQAASAAAQPEIPVEILQWLLSLSAAPEATSAAVAAVPSGGCSCCNCRNKRDTCEDCCSCPTCQPKKCLIGRSRSKRDLAEHSYNFLLNMLPQSIRAPLLPKSYFTKPQPLKVFGRSSSFTTPKPNYLLKLTTAAPSSEATLLKKLKKLNSNPFSSNLEDQATTYMKSLIQPPPGTLRRPKRTITIGSDELDLPPHYEVDLVSEEDEEEEPEEEEPPLVGASNSPFLQNLYQRRPVLAPNLFSKPQVVMRRHEIQSAVREELQNYHKQLEQERKLQKLKEDVLRKKNVVPQNPIFRIITAPMQFLRHFHDINKGMNPVVTSLPKLVHTTKKYFRDFGKNFHKNCLNLASDIIGDFDHVNPSVIQEIRRSDGGRYRRNVDFKSRSPAIDANEDNVDAGVVEAKVADVDEEVKSSFSPKNSLVAAAKDVEGIRKANETNITGQEESTFSTLKPIDSSTVAKNNEEITQGTIEPISSTLSLNNSLAAAAKDVKAIGKANETNITDQDKSPFSTLKPIASSTVAKNNEEITQGTTESISSTLRPNNSSTTEDTEKAPTTSTPTHNIPSQNPPLDDKLNNPAQKNSFKPDYTITFPLRNFPQAPEDTTRKKRYVVQVVDDSQIQDQVQNYLAQQMNGHLSYLQPLQDYYDKVHEFVTQLYGQGNEVVAAAAQPEEYVEEEEEEVTEKPKRRKLKIRKVKPKVIIDNKGLPFLEYDGYKRPLFLKGSKAVKEPSSEESKDRIESLIARAKEGSEIVGAAHNQDYIPQQIIKERISTILEEIDQLVQLNPEDFDSIFESLIKVQHIKTSIEQDWKRLIMDERTQDIKTKIGLLSKFRDLQHAKDDSVKHVAEALKQTKNSFVRKQLVHSMIRLQKLQCLISTVVEDFDQHLQTKTTFNTKKEIKMVDFLADLTFVHAKTRNDLVKRLNKDREAEGHKDIELLHKLKKLLISVDDDYDKFEQAAKLVWELKNLDKLQSQTIDGLMAKLKKKVKVKKELKILFDLQKRYEDCELEINQLLGNEVVKATRMSEKKDVKEVIAEIRRRHEEMVLKAKERRGNLLKLSKS